MNNSEKIIEEKKIYLMKYQMLKKEAERIEESINELRINKMFPSLIIRDMPSAHNHSDLSQYMAVLDERLQELLRVRYKAIEKYTEIYNRIDSVENENEKMVLTYRYLRGYNWEDIVPKMNYSMTSIHRIHGNALKNFEII